jgi:hypothetical protein
MCCCRTTATPAGVVTFLKASFWPFHLSPPEHGGNPRPWGQAVAAILHRPLHGGTVRVAHGVPFRLSESRLAATWSVGVLGAMYTVVDSSRTMLSAGPARSCSSLANSSWRFGWAVRQRVPS